MSDSAGTVSYVNSAMIMTKDAAKMEASKKFLSFLMEPGNYGRFINMEPGLFLQITESGSKDSTFWDDPIAVKYKSQIEKIIKLIKDEPNDMRLGSLVRALHLDDRDLSSHDDDWRIEQFNRNRAVEDQVKTIEEMEEKVKKLFKENNDG